MRPTVSEQIASLSRILADVVAPEVGSPYAADILRGVIGALGALGNAWPKVPAFLIWDAQATAAVLAAALPHVDESLAADISAALDRPADPADWTALETRELLLRGLLVRAMPAILADGGETHRMALALFRERAERFPFQMSAQPVKKPDKEA